VVTKRFLIILLTIGLLSMCVSGCTESKSTDPGVIDHITGAGQIRTYKKARSKIENINKVLEKRYQEIERQE